MNQLMSNDTEPTEDVCSYQLMLLASLVMASIRAIPPYSSLSYSSIPQKHAESLALALNGSA